MKKLKFWYLMIFYKTGPSALSVIIKNQSKNKEHFHAPFPSTGHLALDYGCSQGRYHYSMDKLLSNG